MSSHRPGRSPRRSHQGTATRRVSREPHRPARERSRPLEVAVNVGGVNKPASRHPAHPATEDGEPAVRLGLPVEHEPVAIEAPGKGWVIAEPAAGWPASRNRGRALHTGDTPARSLVRPGNRAGRCQRPCRPLPRSGWPRHDMMACAARSSSSYGRDSIAHRTAGRFSAPVALFPRSEFMDFPLVPLSVRCLFEASTTSGIERGQR